MAFHQQAADQLGGDDLGGAGEEGLGECWEGLSGYGSGLSATYMGYLMTEEMAIIKLTIRRDYILYE